MGSLLQILKSACRRLARSNGNTFLILELRSIALTITSAQNTIEFVPGETVRLDCKMKMGMFSNTFELTSKDRRLATGEPVMAGHHGTLILVFGILGFFIGLFGLVALIQGIADLVKMSQGKMDRSGELLTWIGVSLGAIGFLINAMLILIMFAIGQHL